MVVKSIPFSKVNNNLNHNTSTLILYSVSVIIIFIMKQIQVSEIHVIDDAEEKHFRNLHKALTRFEKKKYYKRLTGLISLVLLCFALMYGMLISF